DLGDAARFGPPLGGDFWFFWAAARLAAQGFPLEAYNVDSMQKTMWLLGQIANFRSTPFFYPPHHLLLLTPLGMLPYLYAWGIYYFLGLVLFLGSVWLWTRRWWMVCAMAGFSGVWVNMVNGQNG